MDKKTSQKRSHARDEDVAPKIPRQEGQIAAHYNALPEAGRAIRAQSPIFFMRNFNNWVKSVLIKTYQSKLFKEGQRGGLIVLDLGSGKGGDLLKWQKGRVNKLVCTDIAGKSVEQSKDRYETNKRKSSGRIFDAEFIVADSSRERLMDKYEQKNIKFDLVSSQFVMHYSYESESQAECMVKNACECLRNGGYFIGTTVNSKKLQMKLDISKNLKFGNDAYSVTFHSKEVFQDFGTCYDFHLEGVVDCPEFVIKREIFEKLCKKHGLSLVLWQTFSQFFYSNINDKDNRNLIQRMKALENFPSRSLNSCREKDYDHAAKVCDDIYNRSNQRVNPRVGTLSATEWEAASIYVVFAFKKDDCKNTSELTDQYDISKEDIPLLVYSS